MRNIRDTIDHALCDGVGYGNMIGDNASIIIRSKAGREVWDQVERNIKNDVVSNVRLAIEMKMKSNPKNNG